VSFRIEDAVVKEDGVLAIGCMTFDQGDVEEVAADLVVTEPERTWQDGDVARDARGDIWANQSTTEWPNWILVQRVSKGRRYTPYGDLTLLLRNGQSVSDEIRDGDNVVILDKPTFAGGAPASHLQAGDTVTVRNATPDGDGDIYINSTRYGGNTYVAKTSVRKA
jgi:hypothetical protein